MDSYNDVALGVEAAWPAFLSGPASTDEAAGEPATPDQQEQAFLSTPTPA